MNLRMKSKIGPSILASSWPSPGLCPRQSSLSLTIKPRPRYFCRSRFRRRAARRQDCPRNQRPGHGDLWVLLRGAGRPGAPGRLILAATLATSPAAPGQGTLTHPLPVIHAGDRLILEEDTALVHARLEAVALSPALAGSALRVRLVPGGFVVHAVALGPGRAAFALGNRDAAMRRRPEDRPSRLCGGERADFPASTRFRKENKNGCCRQTTPPETALNAYIQRVRAQQAAEVRSPGSIWSTEGRLVASAPMPRPSAFMTLFRSWLPRASPPRPTDR